MLDTKKAHYLVVTCIIVRDDNYLIVKRSDNEKAYPGLWTVPGGKIEVEDYSKNPKDAGDFWYNVFEHALRREVLEEVGLRVKNIRYLTSLAYIRSDGIPTIISSMYGDALDDNIKLCKDLSDFAWVSLDDARGYKLIDGIFEELVMLDTVLKSGNLEEWKK